MTCHCFICTRRRGFLHILGRSIGLLSLCILAVLLLGGAWGWAHKVAWEFGQVCK